MTIEEVNESADKVNVEAFHGMRPSFIVKMSDAEPEEFIRIVESEPVADERLARLFERPSPFGKHIDL